MDGEVKGNTTGVVNLDSEHQNNPIINGIGRDFRLSFLFSQGEPEIQLALFTLLARKYKQQEGEISLDEVDSAMRMSFKNQKLPNMHTRIAASGQEISDIDTLLEFEQTWGNEMVILRNVFYGVPIEYEVENSTLNPNRYIEFTNTDLIENIAEGMIERDLRFQLKERPRNLTIGDPHESFVKKYIFEKKPTGSEIYSEIMSETKSFLEMNSDSYIRGLLATLKREWEKNHPGRRFDDNE